MTCSRNSVKKEENSQLRLGLKALSQPIESDYKQRADYVLFLSYVVFQATDAKKTDNESRKQY